MEVLIMSMPGTAQMGWIALIAFVVVVVTFRVAPIRQNALNVA
jgi:hypothetical protein